jgi:hypothetical protein
MADQTRWVCDACAREWVYAHGWDEQTCPACGASTIRLETYQPVFPGADLRTTPNDVPREAETHPMPTPLERPGIMADVNRTLALSSPEFG